jgi:DUF4097 and DUF4098 domain-containing protein YvlB
MTWFYTVLFSGLLFASHGDVATAPHAAVPVEPEIHASEAAETERFEKTYPLDAEGRVSISNINGPIILEAWDKNEASLVVEKTGASKNILDSVKVLIDSDASRFTLRTEQDDWSGRTGSDRSVNVSITIKLPRNARLADIESVTGSISASGFSNLVKLSCVNGNVVMNDLKGSASASTVNGSITAVYSSIAPDSVIELSSVNGPVKLTIPTESNVDVHADTLSGSIRSTFAFPEKTEQLVGRSLNARIGTGGAEIKLESLNGALSIEHPEDGRRPGPITDLDPDKEGEHRSGKMPKAPRADVRRISDVTRKAVEEANRRSAEAMKRALSSAEDEARKAVKANEPLIEASIKAALADAQKELENADIGKEARREARIAMRAASKRKIFADAFGNGRIFGDESTVIRSSKTIAVKGVPTVTIDARGCSVRILGSDSPEVSYTLTGIGDRGDEPNINVTEDREHNSVKIVIPADENNGIQNRLDVTVPSHSDLVVTTDGEIRIEGVTGSLKIQGEEEPVNLYRSSGTLNVETTAGRIRILDFKGSINARTERGPVSIDGDPTALELASDLGDVLLTVADNFSGFIKTEDNSVHFVNVPGVATDKSDEDQISYKIGKGGDKLFKITTAGLITVRSVGDLMARFE